MDLMWKKKNAAKVRLAVKHAALIRNAIKGSIDVDKVVVDWLATHNTSEITTDQAREWARVHIRPNDAKLNEALKKVYVEGFVFGQDVAMSAIPRAKISKAPSLNQMRNAMNIDWDKWKPGNKPAAALVKPSGGLSKLLDSRGVTISGLRKTTLDRIGTQLAYALQEGLPPKEIAADIEELVGDSERALTIAQTETSRAVTVASRELYEDSGVELVTWLVADPCDICQENEDAGPIPIDDTFPSGDTEPPAHPNCVCDLSPYVVNTQNISEDELSSLLEDEEQ
jgi:hypothetical protein